MHSYNWQIYGFCLSLSFCYDHFPLHCLGVCLGQRLKRHDPGPVCLLCVCIANIISTSLNVSHEYDYLWLLLLHVGSVDNHDSAWLSRNVVFVCTENIYIRATDQCSEGGAIS